jgi:CDP-diglyceride synthetase
MTVTQIPIKIVALNTLCIRTVSGTLYVATIILPLLFLPDVYPLVITVYGILAVVEYFRLTIGRSLDPPCCAGLFPGKLFWILLGVVWLIIPFALLALMPVLIHRAIPGYGYHLTITLFTLVWVHDTFAYLVGRAAGKHPLAPAISPAKTVEGAVGGFAFVLLASVAVMYWFPAPGTGFLFWGAVALIVTLFATIGDLSESKLKRLAGVKDSGGLIPGHGGVFDRFDAVIMVVPFWILLVRLFS